MSGDSSAPDQEGQTGGHSGGSGPNEAGIIGGTSVSALVVLVTSTVLTTLVVMLRRYLRRRQRMREAEDPRPEKESR